MARPKNAFPSYLNHKATGQARAVWTDSAGCRHERLLPGRYGSKGSKDAFSKFQLELAACPAGVIDGADGLSVAEAMAAFVEHARRYYRTPDGLQTSEYGEVLWSVRHVREMYGLTPAAEFGPLALRAVREKMIAAGWCRTLINKRIDRVKRAFKWACSMQLVTAAVYHGLQTVAGLRSGRTAARETEPVRPVDPAVVDATLPHLGRHLRAMVELQRLTGMRPGEVCRLRLADVDRSGELWVYRPPQHKTAHHGKDRAVLIGPKGRKVLEEFIAGGRVVDPSGPLFSPRRAREERFAAMRESRKSKVPPSQVNRKKASPDPKKTPAAAYTAGTYAHAVKAAAKKAGTPHWHPNQLRHLYASEVRKNHGLEAAQVLLGHARADVTQVYAEKNASLAASVAAKVG